MESASVYNSKKPETFEDAVDEVIKIIESKIRKLESEREEKIKKINEEYARKISELEKALAENKDINEACLTCEGRGEYMTVDASGNNDWVKCPDCRGTGRKKK